MSDLKTSVYGNPHSGSLSSQITSSIVDQVLFCLCLFFICSLNEVYILTILKKTKQIKQIVE